jgi:hypothetical protein
MITTTRVQKIAEETGKAFAAGKIMCEEVLATGRQFDSDDIMLFTLELAKHLKPTDYPVLMDYLLND